MMYFTNTGILSHQSSIYVQNTTSTVKTNWQKLTTLTHLAFEFDNVLYYLHR